MKSPISYDFNKTVLYEIYVRSFYDSNSDGVGDLAGVIEKLDYLAGGPESLGITAIWLTPFYKSPMADFGYDVADYLDVDPFFGTLADFKKLLKEAHKRGLRVLIDFIPNHTSDKHPWFQSSKSSLSDKYREWYVWRDPKPDGSPPNNWKNVVGGSAWEFDKRTNQYYLHSFLREQPDLNWDNPDVRKALKEVLRFWSKLGVDGFRVDSAEWISKDPEFRGDPVDPDYSAADSPNSYHALLHKRSKRGPNLDAYLKEITEIIDEYPSEFILLESHPHKWDDVDAYMTFYPGDNMKAVAPFNLEALFSPWEATSYRTFIDKFQAALKPNDLPVYAFGNHDISRLASRIGSPAAPTAAMLLLTLPGVPVIYYGDEIGMDDQSIELGSAKDGFETSRPGIGVGRDPERTPLLWNNKSNAGFTSGTPWLPIASDFPTKNIESQLKDKTSLLNLYRQLLSLRNHTDALQYGTYQSYDVEGNVFCYKRALEETEYIVVLNFSDQPLTLDNEIIHGEIVLSTYLDKTDTRIEGQFVLRPHEGLIVLDPK